MSTKKTIQINPELFKMPGNKTRKNKEKKELTLNWSLSCIILCIHFVLNYYKIANI